MGRTVALAALLATALAGVVLGAGAWAGHGSQPETTRLILLGTGTPVPDPDAWGPASAIVVGERLFLVDAGAGVTRRLAAAGFPRVRAVAATFITHLHSDHTLGYPDLLFTTWIMGRSRPLTVYGPPGLRRMTDRILDAWKEDIEVRVTGLERETRAWLAPEVHEIARRGAPGVIYSEGGVRVTAIPVRHGNWAAFAFRFDTPDRSITLSGDTAPTPAFAAAARDTDVLVHEAYNSARVAPEKRPGGDEWPAYLRDYHSSDVEVGRIAAQARAKLLVLTHLLRLGGTDEEILAHVRAGGYSGAVVIGKDLDRF
jgi:ribonuclease BN (tRNA processing enzyme)